MAHDSTVSREIAALHREHREDERQPTEQDDRWFGEAHHEKERLMAVSKWRKRFSTFADLVGKWTGQPVVFLVNVLLVLLWLMSGPLVHFSDKWQLVVNTVTTVLTYLILFVIQNTQNRDSAATHAKLDELLLRIEGPRSELAGIESESEDVIEELRDTDTT